MSFENIKKSVLDLLFPRFCLNCKIVGTYACKNCLSKLKLTINQCCPNCRKVNRVGEFCNEVCAKDYHFDQLIVGMQYDKDSFLKKIIVRFKYKFSKELASTLAEILVNQLCNYFGDFEDCKDLIVVVPVPIHIKKMKQRGFNQARLLAILVSSFFGLEMMDCLERKDLRRDQAKLGREDRLKNLKNTIFLNECYEKKLFEKKVVFLVDDVATTGSTLNECSRVLKNIGTSWICGLVIARGQ